MKYKILKKHLSFDGQTLFCEHDSESTQTKMKFSVFVPKKIEEIDSALIWLSGLTCTEENFITKAGAQKCLAGTNTMIICPDTSPRGVGVAGEDESYDFGSGAGFYVNATTEGYKDNYKMYDYITKDIVGLLKEDFQVNKLSIFGHSMGGHGALVIGLRESELFKSVSAFSPIVHPMGCDWGKKALKGYLGEDQENWKKFDTCELIKDGYKAQSLILIDQGLADEFYPDQLLTSELESTCQHFNIELKVNYRQGYDHSYYFISSFIESHIEFHRSFLN